MPKYRVLRHARHPLKDVALLPGDIIEVPVGAISLASFTHGFFELVNEEDAKEVEKNDEFDKDGTIAYSYEEVIGDKTDDDKWSRWKIWRKK